MYLLIMFLETHEHESNEVDQTQYCEKDGKIVRSLSQSQSDVDVCSPFRVKELLMIKRQTRVHTFQHSLLCSNGLFLRSVLLSEIYRHSQGRVAPPCTHNLDCCFVL